jgi:4-hydroxybenzoate polyprenyltransferase
MGHVALALIGTAVFMGGACIARPNDFYATLGNKEIIIYIFLAFFFLCHLKDLKDLEGDRAGGVFNLFNHVTFPRSLALLFFGAFLVQVCFIALVAGVGLAPVLAAAIVCAGIAARYTFLAGEIARLDRLLVLSFLFLLYVSGAWLVHLGI